MMLAERLSVLCHTTNLQFVRPTVSHQLLSTCTLLHDLHVGQSDAEDCAHCSRLHAHASTAFTLSLPVLHTALCSDGEVCPGTSMG